ncbi:MAG: hypothetical protein WC551_08885 [Patescibacteria group bacterium]
MQTSVHQDKLDFFMQIIGADKSNDLYVRQRITELTELLAKPETNQLLAFRDFIRKVDHDNELDKFVAGSGYRIKVIPPGKDAVKAPEALAPNAPGATCTEVKPPEAKRTYQGSMVLIDRIRHIFLCVLPQDNKNMISIPELMEYLGFPSVLVPRGGRDTAAYVRDYSKLHHLLNEEYKREFNRHENERRSWDQSFVRYSFKG